MVSGRAQTIAHQRPSVTTPIGTPEARSSSSIRSIGLAAQPSSSGSRSESTGSTTRTSAPVVSPRTSAPVGRDGDRVVGRVGLHSRRIARRRAYEALPAEDVAQDDVHPGVPRLAVASSARLRRRGRCPTGPRPSRTRAWRPSARRARALAGRGMPLGQTRLRAGTARNGPSASTSSSQARCRSAPDGAERAAAHGWILPSSASSRGQREHDGRGGDVRLDVGVAGADGGDLALLLVVQAGQAVDPSTSRSRRRCRCWSSGNSFSSSLRISRSRRSRDSRRLTRKAAKISRARAMSVSRRLCSASITCLLAVRGLAAPSRSAAGCAAARRRRSTGPRARGGPPRRRGSGPARRAPGRGPASAFASAIAWPRIRMPVRNTSSCSRRPPRPTRTSRDTAATQDCGRSSTTTAVTRCTGESTLNSALRRMRAERCRSACPRWMWTRSSAALRPTSSSNVIGRSTPGFSRVSRPRSASCHAGAERRDLEDLRVGSSPRPALQRRLPGQLQRGVHDALRVRRGQVHLGLALAVGARQLGEGAVQLHAAGEGAVDDRVAVVARGQLDLAAGAARGEVILDRRRR